MRCLKVHTWVLVFWPISLQHLVARSHHCDPSRAQRCVYQGCARLNYAQHLSCATLLSRSDCGDAQQTVPARFGFGLMLPNFKITGTHHLNVPHRSRRNEGMSSRRDGEKQISHFLSQNPDRRLCFPQARQNRSQQNPAARGPVLLIDPCNTALHFSRMVWTTAVRRRSTPLLIAAAARAIELMLSHSEASLKCFNTQSPTLIMHTTDLQSGIPKTIKHMVNRFDRAHHGHHHAHHGDSQASRKRSNRQLTTLPIHIKDSQAGIMRHPEIDSTLA